MIILLFLSQFELADSLFGRGYYDLAAVEYQRALFFYPESALSVDRRLRFGRALISVRSDFGIAALNRLADEESAVKPGIYSTIGSHFIAAGDYAAAAGYLESAGEPERLGYALLHARRPDQARDAFESAGDRVLVAEIDRFRKESRRSPGKAMVLSLICPGAGEIYAGNIRLAATDFLLNAGSGYLLYNAFRRKKYVDAGLVISFLVNRFYFGSIRNARRSAEEANEKKYDRWLAAVERRHFKNPQ